MGDLREVVPGFESHPCRHAAGGAAIDDLAGEMGPEQLVEVIEAFGIRLIGFFEIPLDVAIGYQGREGVFEEVVVPQIDEPAVLRGLGNKICRAYHEAQADGRGQGLGERADIDHVALVTIAGQGQVGQDIVMVVVVIIVFQDGEIIVRTEVQQSKAALGTQGHGGRMVMVWNEIEQLYRVSFAGLFHGIDIHPSHDRQRGCG